MTLTTNQLLDAVMPDRDVPTWRQFRETYELSFFCGEPRHRWSLVGANGGVHLHLHCYTSPSTKETRWTGGIEVHSRWPTSAVAPSHEECALLKGPCWHDGSSTAAERFCDLMHIGDGKAEPLHAMAFATLRDWYRSHLSVAPWERKTEAQ